MFIDVLQIAFSFLWTKYTEWFYPASLKATTNVIAVPLHPFVGHALGCRFCVISSQPILFKMCTFCTSYYVSKYDKFLLLFLEFLSTAHILSALYLKKAFLQLCSIQYIKDLLQKLWCKLANFYCDFKVIQLSGVRNWKCSFPLSI